MQPEQRIVIEAVSDPLWLKIALPCFLAAISGWLGYVFRRKS